MFNDKLTKNQIDTWMSALDHGFVAQTTIADRIGIPFSTLRRWRDPKYGKTVWDWYSSRVQNGLPEALDTRNVTTPDGRTISYAQAAKELDITIFSFDRRVKKHGAESKKTWVKGKNSKSRANGFSDRITGPAKWGELTGRSRDRNLAKIPGPTKYEKEVIYGRRP